MPFVAFWLVCSDGSQLPYYKLFHGKFPVARNLGSSPVVFPRLNWEPEKAIIKGKLDKNIAVDFLTLLQEKPILRILGLIPKVPEQVNTTLLDKWISLYRSGVMLVDNCQTADTSFFFEEEDNSGNIGGF